MGETHLKEEFKGAVLLLRSEISILTTEVKLAIKSMTVAILIVYIIVMCILCQILLIWKGF